MSSPWHPPPSLPRTRAALRTLALTSIILATLLAGLDQALYRLFKSLGPCEELTLGHLPSPDGAWIATLEQEHCPAGFGGDSIIAGVTLTPASDPTRSTLVLDTDTGGHDDERPRVLWTAPHTLQVTVYARSFLSLMVRQVGPIHIDLRFDPPDPAARADFLREMHMKPQPGE